MDTEIDQQASQELLALILASDDAKRLKICQSAVGASVAASKCFMKGHEIEIDNLRQTIFALSEALLTAIKGNPVDPVMVTTAEKAVAEPLVV